MRTSVIIDNFNYEQYIATAIDSALLQSAGDVEVIVVDDESTDGSRAVIESYGERVRPVFKENGGQGAAMSAAFAVASGEVIVFLDADDLLHPDAVKSAVDALSADPNVVRVQWPLRVIDSRGADTGDVMPSPRMMRSGDLRSHLMKYRTYLWPPTSGSAYRAAFLRQVMPIPPEFRWGSDLYFAEMSALHGPIVSLTEPLGGYRLHGENNWSGGQMDVANIRRRIQWTVDSHELVRREAARLGIDWPADVRDALDVAFLSQRLASLRLEPKTHPLQADTRWGLTARGVWAALRHPHHTMLHRLKRATWITGVGLGPRSVAERWIQRFYFRAAREIET